MTLRIKPEVYSPVRAYANSKLANLLFTFEIQRFFTRKKMDALALAAHPGMAFTNIIRYLGSRSSVNFLITAFGWMIPSARQGALAQVRAAVDPDAREADFYGPSGWGGLWGAPTLVKPHPKAYDEELARQLWKLSEKLTQCYFD